MQAVILAGGKGTRLGQLARDVPKPMVPVLQKPILEHQVELLRRHGIRDIVMITGHMSSVIEEYFGDGSSFDVSVRYFVEETPLGTTGGIKMAESLLEDEFFVLYGDVMMDVDLGRMLEFHQRVQSRCTLALHPNDHPYDSDLVEIDNSGRVTAFHAKPHPAGFEYHNLVNAALYVLTKDVVKEIIPGVKADFGKDLFPRIAASMPMYGYVTPEYMKDVGTPERIAAVEKDLASGKFARRSLTNKRPAIFLDRDGVLNKEVNLLSRVEQMELLPDVAQAVALINQSDYLGIVVTNQPVIARNLCTLEQLDAIHKRLETRLGECHAWLDAIEFCPHHPDAGYPGENPAYKMECDCRKPKTGMIERASRRFNIDGKKSWIIGDSARDIECGQRAGLQTAGVRTGYGCKDAQCQPDYMFDDLWDAVQYIIDDPCQAACHEIVAALPVASSTGPLLILVAGLPRAGKTVFSKRLARELNANGLRTTIMTLDTWLVPVAERTPEMDVFARFRSAQASRDIEKILAGEEIVLPGYDAANRLAAASPVRLGREAADIVIVEGVTAFHESALCERAVCRILVETSADEHEARFKRFYEWKGLPAEEIKSLFTGRFAAESRAVKDEFGKADRRVQIQTSRQRVQGA